MEKLAQPNLNDQIQSVMLNFKKGQLLGIDIGLSSVKMALLSPLKKNNFRIERFAHFSLSEAAIIEDDIQKPAEVTDLIRKGLAKLQYKDGICCVGIDGPNTMTKRLQIPDGTREELEDNVLWESEQYIPFGADDSELDFQVIGDVEGEDGVKDIIVSAAKSSVIEHYSKVAETAGLKVKVVDLKVFALNNIFESIMHDSLPELRNGTILIDFGAQTTKIVVYKRGAPVLTKEILMGGVLVTEEIQRQMGVNYFEAEDLKVNGDESGNLPEEIMPLIDIHIDNLMSEIRKVLNFYIASGSTEQVDYCFVTGGSSLLPGLRDALSSVIGIEALALDPFLRLEASNKIEKTDLPLIRSCGLVALGLGMRKI